MEYVVQKPSDCIATYNAIDPTTKELLDLIEGMDTAQRRQMVDVARIIFRPPRIIE